MVVILEQMEIMAPQEHQVLKVHKVYKAQL
jgi:hypothetical protein